MFLKATATDLCLNIHALYAPAMDHRTNNYLFLCVSLYVQKDLARMRTKRIWLSNDKLRTK